MDYDNEEGFPGLYYSESGRKSNESDYSDADHDKPSKKDLLMGRRKDKKDSKKDRGYAALAGESSPDEDAETKSPSKSKKTKAFKFPSKSKEKREKSRDKEKVGEKELKEKEKEILEREKKKEKHKKEKEKREKEKEEKTKVKELKEKVKEKDKHKEKEKTKDKDKDKKGSKQQPTITAGIPFEEIFTLGVAQPIFGVSLGLAVERSRCHDDSNLPLVVRDCIDYLQDHGLHSEAIYRIEPTKQKVLALRKLYNDREAVSTKDYEVATACSLLKLFITLQLICNLHNKFRELPEPILTTELCAHFEDQCNQSPSSLLPLIGQLPTSHRALLGWLMCHLAAVLANERTNRLNAQTLGSLIGPTLNMSTPLLLLFMFNTKLFFPDIKLTKYVPPLTSSAPRLPETAEEITLELRKQESLLSQIHAEMHAGFVTQKREEQLWEGQRIVTQLKRKLRSVQKSCEPSSSSQTQSSLDERQLTHEEELPDRVDAAIQLPQVSNEDVFSPSNGQKVMPPVQEAPSSEAVPEVKPAFPVTDTFEDNFEGFEETPETTSAPISKNEMTESLYSNSSDTVDIKKEKPKFSNEELQLLRLQLEHAEFLHLKSLLQTKIDAERFEIVKLRSHMAIKNKQENNTVQKEHNAMTVYTDAENEERQRLMKENCLLEQERLALTHQIFEERIACIQLRVQLAMNEIL